MTRRFPPVLLAALAALAASAKSVDDFVGAYTPPVSGIQWTPTGTPPAGLLLRPAPGMAVGSNEVSSIGFAYDRFCGLADLTSPDFADLGNRRAASFPFASEATRLEVPRGSALDASAFDHAVAAAGAFLDAGAPVQPASGDWMTTPLYCPAAADYEGSLFRAYERAAPPSGTLEGAPCRGGASVPCLGAAGRADTSMAAVGQAFAAAVGGTFEADGGVDCTLDEHFGGDDLFEGGALARDASGEASLRVEPWLKLADLANGMNAWAALLREIPAKFRLERTTQTRSVSVSVSQQEDGGQGLKVEFSSSGSTSGPDVSDAATPERSCTMSKADGDAPKDADGDVQIDVSGTVEAHYSEVFDEPWQYVSEERGDGYTLKKYRCKSRLVRIAGRGGVTWTSGLGTYTLGTATRSECVPVAIVDPTDAKLLTDAQRAYYGMGKLLVGGHATTRRQGEADATERHVVAVGGISPDSGYEVKGALGVLLDGYAKDADDEADISRERSRIMMADVQGSASVSYDIPNPDAPESTYRYKYELVMDDGSASTNRYWGATCECYLVDGGCTCENTGIRCATCEEHGCGCCYERPGKGDDGDEDWGGGGTGGGGTGGGSGGETGGGTGGEGESVRVVTASASAVVRIPAAGTNAYSYLRTATAPKCLVLARINSTAGGWPSSVAEVPCDIYVDGSAGSGGDGSKGSPFSSLDDAVGAADPEKQGAAQAQSARAAARTLAAEGEAASNAVKRIGIRRGTYDMPALFNRSPFKESAYPVELVGLGGDVVLRKTTRYATGAYDADGQPLTTLRNLTVECGYAGKSHRMSCMVFDGCRISGVVTSNYSVVEASVLRGCAFEGLTFAASAHNGTDVAPVVYGSDVSNCVFEVAVANPDVTSLAEASTVVDCLVRGGEYAALQSFGVDTYNKAFPFDRCTICPSNVLAQAQAAKDDKTHGSLALTNCLVFVDGFTNAPPLVADNLMTNRAAAAGMLNPVTWRPKASFREWRRKGYHSAR